MREFAGRIAVVTGGGSGMGRELVRQLVAEACNVSMCDLAAEGMAETVRLCETAGLPQGLRVTTHIVDVSDFAQMERFRAEVTDRHATDRIHLLFNNAGIGGGGSLIVNSCEEWERTFNVCWGSVYNGTRAFLPLLLKAEEGHIVNTSSVNGFWASIGPHLPQTAYAAAKFAVKGFTEALITDLRINAPHIKCSVVMPGHIGTSIPLNTRKVQSGNQADAMDATQLAQARAALPRWAETPQACQTTTSGSGSPSASAASARRRRPAPPKRRRSSSTESRPTNGAFWSGQTPIRSMNWSAGRPSAPMMSISSSSSRARLAGGCRPDIAPTLRFTTGGEVGEGPYLDRPRKSLGRYT